MKNRKIIQITGTPSGLYALCDDGTVWWLVYSGYPGQLGWKQTPAIGG